MTSAILQNQTLVSACSAWVVAQVMKTLIDCRMNGSFKKERLVGSGGMPSSHSSTVTALATSAGMCYGVGSYQFTVAFILAMVVMYDARGVRLETEKQAKILNHILEENPFDWSEDIVEERLKEFVGHTFFQVIVGALLGFFIAVVIGLVFY